MNCEARSRSAMCGSGLPLASGWAFPRTPPAAWLRLGKGEKAAAS